MKVVNDFVDAEKIERIVSSSQFDPYACDELIEITTNLFLNKFKNQNCFIVGTGSSLHHHDLKYLEGQTILSMNNIWLCPDLVPKYWFLCADSYIPLLRNSRMARNFLLRRDIVKFFGIKAHPHTDFFLSGDFIKEFLSQYPNVFFIRIDTGRLNLGEPLKLLGEEFYPSTFNQFFHGVDVTSSMVIPSSYLMGFKNAYLLGIHKKSPFHFYDTPYLMNRVDETLKQQRRFEFWSRLKHRLFGFEAKYGSHPKVMTARLFDHLYQTHAKKFKDRGGNLLFIEDKLATYDVHQFERIPFDQAVHQEAGSGPVFEVAR